MMGHARLYSSRTFVLGRNALLRRGSRGNFERMASSSQQAVQADQRKACCLPEFIRNIAIIAHVDHGKTTLVDGLLKQSGCLDAGFVTGQRVMDSNEIERERGITILSKCTAIERQGYRINIVDTPGHADFGGEVERVLSMVDGALLVIDANEGAMAQTKFVLGKALARRLKIIVVLNKLDRPGCRNDEIESELFDLFIALGAEEDQMDYPTLFASARDGWAFTTNPLGSLEEGTPIQGTLNPLFDAIINTIPSPDVKLDMPFSMLVTSLEANPYLGRCMIGRVSSGVVRVGDRIKAVDPTGKVLEEAKVARLSFRRGLEQITVDEMSAGDIASIAGIPLATVNSTVCHPDVQQPIPCIPIDPPTVSMIFSVNSSPLAGTEGKALTGLAIYERILKECDNNVSMSVQKTDKADSCKVFGRGELQLGVLVETIRREGVELALSPPSVVYKTNERGEKLEPVEEVFIDCPAEYSGTVIEKLCRRKAELLRMVEMADKVRMVFKCSVRGLIGYASEFKNDTHGHGLLNHSFAGYEPFKGQIEVSRKGCLIANGLGQATAYAISELEARGTLFVQPGTKVYQGMVVGETARSGDMDVNPCRLKAVSNVRTVLKDEGIRITPPRVMNLEEAIAYVGSDEMIEVTPKSIRIRKADLDPNVRRAKAHKRS